MDKKRCNIRLTSLNEAQLEGIKLQLVSYSKNGISIKDLRDLDVQLTVIPRIGKAAGLGDLWSMEFKALTASNQKLYRPLSLGVYDSAIKARRVAMQLINEFALLSVGEIETIIEDHDVNRAFFITRSNKQQGLVVSRNVSHDFSHRLLSIESYFEGNPIIPTTPIDQFLPGRMVKEDTQFNDASYEDMFDCIHELLLSRNPVNWYSTGVMGGVFKTTNTKYFYKTATADVAVVVELNIGLLRISRHELDQIRLHLDGRIML